MMAQTKETPDRLVSGRHANVYSAALSIAANRASKIALLRREGLDDRAARYERNLAAACERFVAEHPNHPPRFRLALKEAATP
jgi:hypothetical protein